MLDGRQPVRRWVGGAGARRQLAVSRLRQAAPAEGAKHAAETAALVPGVHGAPEGEHHQSQPSRVHAQRAGAGRRPFRSGGGGGGGGLQPWERRVAATEPVNGA